MFVNVVKTFIFFGCGCQITIFDLIRDTPESLWERLTDGIMRAWSYDQGKYMTKHIKDQQTNHKRYIRVDSE